MFEAGDFTQTHRIIIDNDNDCEKEPNENFFSEIALESGIPDIFVTGSRATVTINDTAEPECGRLTYIYIPTLNILSIKICMIAAVNMKGTARGV